MKIQTAKKRKFNAIDAAIIIVIIALIGAAAAFFAVRGISEDPQKTTGVEYVVQFREIRQEFADNFSIGTAVTDSVAKYHIGKVIAVNVENSVYSGENLLTGELVSSDYPERVDVQLTIESEAVLGGGGVFILDGGYRISVGTTVHIRTPNFTGTAYCTEIKEATRS